MRNTDVYSCLSCRLPGQHISYVEEQAAKDSGKAVRCEFLCAYGCNANDLSSAPVYYANLDDVKEDLLEAYQHECDDDTSTEVEPCARCLSSLDNPPALSTMPRVVRPCSSQSTSDVPQVVALSKSKKRRLTHHDASLCPLLYCPCGVADESPVD